MFCNNCGTSLSDDIQFCPQCGKQQNSPISAKAASLLKRALIFLEEEQWGKADDYCEQALDIEPENSQAYVIKLMIRAQVKKEEDLANANASYASWSSYQNALRFADDALKKKLTAYLQSTEESIRLKELEATRKEQERLLREEEQLKSNIYRDACRYYSASSSSSDLSKAINLFRKIPGYKDATERLAACNQRLEVLRKERMEQLLRKQRKKRFKVLITILAVAILIAAVVLICIAVNDSNLRRAEEKAQEIRSQLAGMSFSGSYTSYSTSSSEDQFKPVSSMTKYDVTYSFKENGVVTITTTSYEGKGTYYTDENGERIWDDISTSSRAVPRYNVAVSSGGRITVTIDGKTFVLELNSSGVPHSLVYNGITYSR